MAQSIPEIAIDLDASTTAIESTRTVESGVTYDGVVRLVFFPTVGGNAGFTGYNLKMQALPCAPGGLCAASSGPGDHILDAAAGADTSDAASCTIGRVLLSTAALFQTAPAEVFTFQYCASQDVTLTFLSDSPVYGLTTLGQAFLLQNGDVTVNTAVVHIGQVPTDTPTPETTFTPTPTDTPTPETTFTPTMTPTPSPTQLAAEAGLVVVDGFAGVHTSPQDQVVLNTSCENSYSFPEHMVRDSALLPSGEGFEVLDLFGHVFTYSLTETCFPQIPDESQFYFYPSDVAVAVEPANNGTGAYVLIDTGEILAIGDAAPGAIPSVSPALPPKAPDPADYQFVIPGPVQGTNPIGTIATTGGWNGDSAIDFALTSPSGALVLSRNGKVTPVGDAETLSFGESPAAPWFWPDLARRIKYMNVNGTDYYMILEGLGGIHVAGGSPGDALRTDLQTNVLSGQLAYFAAQLGTGDFVGIDAANDFVPVVYNGGTSIGIMMLDGLGAIHHANLPFTFNWTVYFPGLVPVQGEPYNQLDTAVSLMYMDLTVPQ